MEGHPKSFVVGRTGIGERRGRRRSLEELREMEGRRGFVMR